MKIGIIGVGKMGNMLCRTLLTSKAVSPEDVHITQRSNQHSTILKQDYPTIHVHQTLDTLLPEVNLIIICLRPLDIHPVLKQFQTQLSNKMVLSITSPITVNELASLLHTNVARVVPSITNQTKSGVTLVTFHPACDANWKQTIFTLLQSFSTPVIVTDEVIRISSDITSCGPAFISSLLRTWMEAASKHTSLDPFLAEHFMREMMIGFGKLMEKEYDDFQTLENTVIVKGGVTGVGIHVIEKHAPPLFDELVLKTQEKFADDRQKIIEQFSS